MNYLAAFDLDGTLIEGDSFRSLVRRHLLRRPLLLPLGLARRVGLISRSDFAESAHRQLRALFQDQAYLSAVVEEFASIALPERLALVQAWRDRGATTLLLSSSPNDYVAPLGRRLGFDVAAGSEWRGGRYRHLHGDAKVAFIEQEFPAHAWTWAFAISDARSDERFLMLFDQSERVGPLAALAG